LFFGGTYLSGHTYILLGVIEKTQEDPFFTKGRVIYGGQVGKRIGQGGPGGRRR
jgi:hypothetical protein